MPKKLDLTNQKFGKLTAIKQGPSVKGRGTAWICSCECGNEITVLTNSLRSGNTKSCGCLHKQTISNLFSKDLTNQKFGKLLAIKPTEKRKHGSIVWECLCECGNVHYSSAELLLSGKVNSCGCLHSKGNQKIQQILEDNHIPFIKEYQIRINNINYYYDFALYQNNKIILLIEYDGVLHFEQNEHRGWNNPQTWEKTKKNDNIKNQFAKDNNIPLLRVPYFDFDNLDIEYIRKKASEICTVAI